jgi:predicted dehydrogenase
VHGRLPGDLGHVAEVWDEEDFWQAGLDAVVIANPTSLHGSALVRAAERGLAIFVEKPLVASLDQLPTLSEPITRRVVVGFCLRFHPLVRAIRRILTAGATSPGQLGRVLKARLYFGSYLPRWQPNVD